MGCALAPCLLTAAAAESTSLPRAFVDGTGPGWRELGESDFAPVNCPPTTWTWKDGVIQCTGQPVGVIRSTQVYTNLELVVEWRHLKAAGNSGVFSGRRIPRWPGSNPGASRRVASRSRRSTTGHRAIREADRKEGGLVHHSRRCVSRRQLEDEAVPAGLAGRRSQFPVKALSKGVGEWNHYYVRAVNGEVRLWVNGEEVSGGTACEPRSGRLCLESEGSPVEFRNLRIRVLP